MHLASETSRPETDPEGVVTSVCRESAPEPFIPGYLQVEK